MDYQAVGGNNYVKFMLKRKIVTVKWLEVAQIATVADCWCGNEHSRLLTGVFTNLGTVDYGSSAGAETIWKCSGIAVQFNLNCSF
jgi:hypothetical protein